MPRTGAVLLYCKAYEVLQEERWLQLAKEMKAWRVVWGVCGVCVGSRIGRFEIGFSLGMIFGLLGRCEETQKHKHHVNTTNLRKSQIFCIYCFFWRQVLLVQAWCFSPGCRGSGVEIWPTEERPMVWQSLRSFSTAGRFEANESWNLCVNEGWLFSNMKMSRVWALLGKKSKFLLHFTICSNIILASCQNHNTKLPTNHWKSIDSI